MMKRIGLLCVIFLFTVQLHSQDGNSLNRLLIVHDSVSAKYRGHIDTVTLNSWLNIMQSNRYLSLLHFYDSLIKVEYAATTKPDSANMILNRQLIEFQKEIKYLKSNYENEQATAGFYRKMYFMLIALALVFLVIIIALALVAGRTGKKLSEKDQLHKKQYTELHAIQVLIEKSRKTENQMASEINRLKKQLGQSESVSREDYQVLQEEKLMLENQMLEIRKAFELESQKRMEAEILNGDQKTEAELEKETHEIAELRASLSLVRQDNINLNEQFASLKSANESLLEKLAELEQLREKYKELLGEQSALADDLENMINRLKNKLNLE